MNKQEGADKMQVGITHAFRVYIENCLSDLDRKIAEVVSYATAGTNYSNYHQMCVLAAGVGDLELVNRFAIARDKCLRQAIAAQGWNDFYFRLTTVRDEIVGTLELLNE